MTSGLRRGDPNYLPDKLAELVNIVFAVVIAESLARYNHEILHLSPQLLLYGLLIVYAVTISSWWGYHRSLTDYPYANSPLGFSRFVVDLATVGVYAYLIYAAREIINERTAERFLWGIPPVFLMYIASGNLRRIEWGAGASKQIVLILFTFASFVVAVAYTGLRSEFPDELKRDTWTWLFLTLALIVVLGFRWWRLPFYVPLAKDRNRHRRSNGGPDPGDPSPDQHGDKQPV